jgi:hypothetical protein
MRGIPEYDDKLLIVEGINPEDVQRAKDFLLTSKAGR